MRRSSSGAETPNRVTGLAQRIADLEAAFACGGEVTLPAPVSLRFADGRSIRVASERAWNHNIGKRLKARCGPAPFGFGRETRRDPRVRDGAQLLAKEGGLQVSGLDLEASGILSEIRRTLCPEDTGNPAPELYALNVYGRGGHFAAHKDTPRDPDVFGTLVVALPVPFRGGDLVLRQGSTRRFAWETENAFGFGGKPDTYTVRWAAFYNDVDHKIEQIFDGTRVTLTWLLRRSAPERPPLVRRPVAGAADLEADLTAAVADLRFLPQGGLLGIACTHLYTALPGRNPFAETLSDPRVPALKGRDRIVAAAALGAGLPVRVRPYIFETSGDENWRLERPPTDRERRIFGRGRLDALRIEQELPVEHHADWDAEDDVTWVTAPPWIRGQADEAEPAADFLNELEYSTTGYFGNEGGHAAFYVSAVLLVEIPPARKRKLKMLRSARRTPRASRR